MSDIYSVPGSDADTPLRYDPDKIMNPPYGVVLQVGDLPRAPRVESLSGSRQAAALMLAQFPLDPLRLSARKPSPSTKLNSAQRRAARIAAGKLKVSEDGKLVGLAGAQRHIVEALTPFMGERMAKAAVGIG